MIPIGCMQNIPTIEEPDMKSSPDNNGLRPQKSDNFRVYHYDGTLKDCLRTGISCMLSLNESNWSKSIELDDANAVSLENIAVQHDIGIYIFKRTGMVLSTIRSYNIKPDIVPLRLLLDGNNYKILFTQQMLSLLPDSIYKHAIFSRCQTLDEWSSSSD